MITNYLLVAFRSFKKNRSYFLTHLVGLVAGIVSCSLIAFYLLDEYTYDQFHQKGERIYRLNTDLIFPDNQLNLALAPGPAAPTMAEKLPEIESFVRLARPGGKMLFKKEAVLSFEENLYYADSSFFEVFDFPLQTGEASSVLSRPYTLVISEEKAHFYFGQNDPIGESLVINDQPFQITGILGAIPKNSQLSFDFLLSFNSWTTDKPFTNSNWTWTNFPTYLLLKPGANPASLSSKFEDFLKSNIPPDQNSLNLSMNIEPFLGIHFSPARLGDLKPNANSKYLFFLSLTAIFILLLAVFNYVNLSIAMYTGRTRDIGVRKTLGAGNNQIAFQYLTESFLLCFTAVLFSVVFIHLILPFFGRLLDRAFSWEMIGVSMLLILSIAVPGVLSLLTGAYPAFIMSRLQPIDSLQSKGFLNLGKAGIRRMLNVVQFTMSIGLIISSLVVWQQLNYLMEKDLGFDKENKLVVNFGESAALKIPDPVLKQELLRLPEVESVAFSSHIPSEMPHGILAQIDLGDGQNHEAEISVNLIDFDFIDLYGLEVVAGRKFSPEFRQDTAGALILNRTAVQLLGFSSPEDVIGKEVVQWPRNGSVVGVVEDFNFTSLHSEAGALAFQISPALFEKLTIKYKNGHLPTTLGNIEKGWNNVVAHLPFEYSFLDDRLALQYENDRRFALIFLVFTSLAILLACLGLIGLVAYTCQQKSKSIAIRKVFGAQTSQIIWALFRPFSWPVLLGWILAILPVYWLLDNWLDDFAYRISIQFSWILLTGIFIIGLTYLVVSWRSWSTANANPVNFLKEM